MVAFLNTNSWNESQVTTERFDVSYLVVEDHVKFPVDIIKKMVLLDKTLREWRLPGLSICGKSILLKEWNIDLEIKPYNPPGPWKNCRSIEKGNNKSFVVAAMCTLIALENEDFITDISIKKLKEDGEIKDLWQTAWTIILNMQEKENENAKHGDEREMAENEKA